MGTDGRGRRSFVWLEAGTSKGLRTFDDGPAVLRTASDGGAGQP